MADTRRTKVGFWRACYLCFLCIFNPKGLTVQQERDNADRNQFKGSGQNPTSASIVCRAFWLSLLLVLISVGVGCLVGRIVGAISPPWVSAHLVIPLQVIGAFLLLWGTLFVRGWEIQTYCSVTLTERVNQWIYRTLYCLGTALIVLSLALPAQDEGEANNGVHSISESRVSASFRNE